MSGLLLKGVNKIYPGGNHALFDLTLSVKDKEFMVFTGPSESGKSTLLRMIAGLEEASGEISLFGRALGDIPPKERDLAYLSQLSLYSHLSVYDNLAYGLKVRKVQKEIIDVKVKAAAELLGVKDVLPRKPKALSSFQRQRVALGRSVVREPKAFLFDDPFSNLDQNLRGKMRAEIGKLFTRLETLFLYSTSDPLEAMALGTRVAVLKDGFLQQADTPQNLYDYPVNLFVASYFGSLPLNVFRAALTRENGKVYANVCENKILLSRSLVERIKRLDEYQNTGKEVLFAVRPEDVLIKPSEEECFFAEAALVERLGESTVISCDLKEGAFLARVEARANVSVGERLPFYFDPNRILLFDAFTEASMLEKDKNYLSEYEEDRNFVPLSPQEERELKEAGKRETKAKKH